MQREKDSAIGGKGLGKRILLYLAGLVILAFGIVFSINSNLGISPTSSFPYAVHQLLVHNGANQVSLGSFSFTISLGMCMNLVYIVFVLLQIVLLRRDFKPINLLQIVVSTISGESVNLAQRLMGSFAIPTFAGQLLMLAISILLIALGILCYLTAEIIPMPSEGLGLAIAQKFKLKYHNVKMGQDCTYVSLALIVGFLGFGRVVGVGLGTLVTALVTGKLIGLLSRLLRPSLERFCFGPKGDESPVKPE